MEQGLTSAKLFKVLVVDDSPTMRTALTRILSQAPDLRVVGEAANGKQAVTMTGNLRPDVILMDVFMPEMDGLEATEEIMHKTPTPIVIISGSVDEKEANLAFKAISSGALTAIRKPPGPSAPDYAAEVKELINTVRAMAEVQVIHRWKSEPAPPVMRPALRPVLPTPTVTPQIVAIVASTGGPSALSDIVRGLPAGFPLPMVIVQHMTSGFIPSLVTLLDGVTPLTVKIAVQDTLPQPRTIYVAPGDLHLRITRRLRFDLSCDTDGRLHVPSGDVFLNSVAEAYGSQAIGIVLTGMGEDGANGLRAMYSKGSLTIAQDEASSVVYGMPRRAVEMGAARYVVPLSEIANTLTDLVKAGIR